MRKLFFFYYCSAILISFFVFHQGGFAAPEKKIQLTLQDAIMLAVRTNPNVQISRFSDEAQKFNLYVQEWQFQPHYALAANGSIQKANSSASLSPSISLLTPIGTQVAFTSSNTQTSHFNPTLTLSIMQPLMRGFGTAVVESALANAKDSDVISRLNIEGTLRTTVTAVINAYLDVVSAERTIIIDEKALQRAETSVEQTKLFIKVGHKAGNELVTVRANVASAKAQLENDRNNQTQARYALLSAIGIDPNTNVAFSTLNIDKLIHKYDLPTLDNAKQWILRNDIQYQVDQITLHGSTQRSLLIAEDNTRSILNFSVNASTAGGTNNGFNGIFNNTTQNVEFFCKCNAWVIFSISAMVRL